MRSKPRDSQRSKVYAAESVLRSRGAPGAERLETVDEIQAWCDQMTASKWWKDRYPHVRRIRVTDGRSRRRAGGCPMRQRIYMPRWSRNKAVILHEIAHVVTSPYVAWHGWEFCDNLLKLVSRWLGQDEARRLRESFKAKKVRYRAPRKRKPVSPERRAELVAQLERARAARLANV